VRKIGEAFLTQLITADQTWDKKEQDKEWYWQGMHALVSRHEDVEVDGDFVENHGFETNLPTWTCVIFMSFK
jgi:hypothetical protein